MAGITVRVTTGGARPITGRVSPAIVMTTSTNAEGAFHFDKIPDLPVVTVERDGFAPQTIDASGKGTLDIKLVPNVLSGAVLAPDGKPVPGASIVVSGTRVLAGSDGKYLTKGFSGD